MRDEDSAESAFDDDPPTVSDPWARLPMALAVEMDRAERASAALLAEED